MRALQRVSNPLKRSSCIFRALMTCSRTLAEEVSEATRRLRSLYGTRATHVSLDIRLLARTGPVPVSEESARTRVHGAHKEDPCRKPGGNPGTGHGEEAFFEGLAELLQGLAPEFRQLVQEKYPVVGQADLPGSRQGPSPDEPGVRDVMMGRPEGPTGDKGRLERQQARHAVNARRF